MTIGITWVSPYSPPIEDGKLSGISDLPSTHILVCHVDRNTRQPVSFLISFQLCSTPFSSVNLATCILSISTALSLLQELSLVLLVKLLHQTTVGKRSGPKMPKNQYTYQLRKQKKIREYEMNHSDLFNAFYIEQNKSHTFHDELCRSPPIPKSFHIMESQTPDDSLRKFHDGSWGSGIRCARQVLEKRSTRLACSVGTLA